MPIPTPTKNQKDSLNYQIVKYEFKIANYIIVIY